MSAKSDYYATGISMVRHSDMAWETRFGMLLRRCLGKREGKRLWQKYQAAFCSEYRTLLPPRYAVRDLFHIEQLQQGKSTSLELLAPCQAHHDYRLQFYSDSEKPLDEYLPLLTHLNLRLIDQVQFTLDVAEDRYFIRSFEIASAAAAHAEPLFKSKTRLLEAIRALASNKVENDALNSLLVATGMTWKEIDVLRAYRNYYLQLSRQSSRPAFHHALLNHPDVARCLFEYFAARFKPSEEETPTDREEMLLAPLRMHLLGCMESVSNINDDRILRMLFNLIDATVRSNFHLRRNSDDYFLAFKVNSLGVIEMPPPRPEFEIYVHAADMQGIHLRNGKIARGGIRWSNRPDDFRSEVLSLMQTQISKNALIVPTGAKGGFIVRRNRTSEPLEEAGKNAYRRLIRGLLDLTDNFIEGKAVRPPGIIAYDDNDPYLVVAADKGTARFSDIANSISAEYRFWLRDAFASGGSHGYDHKALGITARGAWECIKRHFREMGKDIQTEPFTVVGIGSMDGDVFGNGMQLSQQIKLRAAFSDRHIFIDPNPDPQQSFNERKRLFELPGSSWDDYDRKLISKGGGVYPRDAKDISISTELRVWLGIRYRMLDGESLIRYLLTAPTDLLWLGGIGTYIKASSEKHEDVGDHSNDNVRVDASELRAAVVGEGANLGFTQKARIEYALAGGRINTDAVDNSAGVDTSDHEVNLKILLFELQKHADLVDSQTLFTALTGFVCRSVLMNNYAQSLCLSLDQLRNAENPEMYLHLAERLQAAGTLDLTVESFPPAKEVLARPGARLTRPELAVLMSASKRLLTQQLQEQPEFIGSDYCVQYLRDYFPEPLTASYGPMLAVHPLANAIIATTISNRAINQAGCGFLALVAEADGSATADVVGTYFTYDQLLDGQALRRSIYELDNQISAESQYHLLLPLESALRDLCRRQLLHGVPIRPDPPIINRYRGYLLDFLAVYPAHTLPPTGLTGIPDELLQRLSVPGGLGDFPLCVALAESTGISMAVVVRLMHETVGYISLQAIRERLTQIPLHNQWERKLLDNLRESLSTITRNLVKDVLRSEAQSCAAYFNAEQRIRRYNRWRHICQEISTAPLDNLLPYAVLVKELEEALAVS